MTRGLVPYALNSEIQQWRVLEIQLLPAVAVLLDPGSLKPRAEQEEENSGPAHMLSQKLQLRLSKVADWISQAWMKGELTRWTRGVLLEAKRWMNIQLA